MVIVGISTLSIQMELTDHGSKHSNPNTITPRENKFYQTNKHLNSLD